MRCASFFASSAVQLIVSLRPQHVDLPEAGRRAAVAHRVDLLRLPLAVRVETDVLPGRLAAQTVAGLPEVRRAALIGHVGDHRPDLAALDLPEGIAPEL